MFALCYSDIPNRVADTKTDVQLLLQFVTKYFTLFHIVTSSISSQISELNFDYCYCFDMFYYPTFLIHQNVLTDLRYRLVLFKIYHLGGGEKTFLFFCDLNKTLIFTCKYRMEACPQMSYDLVF